MSKGKKLIICIVAAFVVVAAVIAVIFIVRDRNRISATTMRLLRIQGKVALESGGKKKDIIDNLKLNSGDVLTTETASLASIALDDTKMITLEESSEAEFNQDGKKLDLNLKKGSLYFEVTKKLEAEETFEIRTSTMVAAIRGTSGYVFVEKDGQDGILLTDGEVEVTGINPKTGETKVIHIGAGDVVRVYLFDDEDPGKTVDFELHGAKEEDLPDEVIEYLVEHEELLEKVCDETGWDEGKIRDLGKERGIDPDSKKKTTPTAQPTAEPTKGQGDDSASDNEVTPTVSPNTTPKVTGGATTTETPTPTKADGNEASSVSGNGRPTLPTLSPTPTEEPVPDDPVPTEEPSVTPVPTEEPTPAVTPAPTEGPAPTEEPTPTEETTPTEEPTEEPTPTDEPTPEPGPGTYAVSLDPSEISMKYTDSGSAHAQTVDVTVSKVDISHSAIMQMIKRLHSGMFADDDLTAFSIEASASSSLLNVSAGSFGSTGHASLEVSLSDAATADDVGSYSVSVTVKDAGSNIIDTKNLTVKITDPRVRVTGVSLNKNSLELGVSETETLTATVTPDNATNSSVRWSSSDESVAVVTDGVVKAVAAGSATIRVTTEDGGYTDSCAVTVITRPFLSVSPTSLSLAVGGKATITASLLYDDSWNAVTWISSDPDVVEIIDQSERSYVQVKALKAGTAYIRAMLGSGSSTWADCNITVTDDTVSVTGVKLDVNSLEIESGQVIKLNATVLPSDATITDVSWSSDNMSVAEVSDSGVVMAGEVGTANITVTTLDGGFTDTCAVTVVSESVAVTGVELDKSSAELDIGDTLTLTATVKPDNATNKNVSWSSSDTDVATVNNGLVTAVASGTATITVTTQDGSKTADCAITVKEEVSPVGLSLGISSASVELDLADRGSAGTTINVSLSAADIGHSSLMQAINRMHGNSIYADGTDFSGFVCVVDMPSEAEGVLRISDPGSFSIAGTASFAVALMETATEEALGEYTLSLEVYDTSDVKRAEGTLTVKVVGTLPLPDPVITLSNTSFYFTDSGSQLINFTVSGDLSEVDICDVSLIPVSADDPWPSGLTSSEGYVDKSDGSGIRSVEISPYISPASGSFLCRLEVTGKDMHGVTLFEVYSDAITISWNLE